VGCKTCSVVVGPCCLHLQMDLDFNRHRRENIKSHIFVNVTVTYFSESGQKLDEIRATNTEVVTNLRTSRYGSPKLL
jgi:hypothetical protein